MNIQTPPGVDIPGADTVVWRYMGLEKFLDLLIYSRLHFANVASLSDQYEATIPSRNVDERRAALEKQGLAGRDLDEALLSYEWPLVTLRGGTLVNCWSALAEESYALWRIYLSDSRSGVAVRSTVGRLQEGIARGEDPYPDDLFLGRVRYSDHIPEQDPSRFSLIYTKTRFYEFEQEIRLAILEYPPSEGGVARPYRIADGRTVQLDLDTVIDRIVLSPFAGSWFQKSFNAIVEKVTPGLADRIVRSSVRDT